MCWSASPIIPLPASRSSCLIVSQDGSDRGSWHGACRRLNSMTPCWWRQGGLGRIGPTELTPGKVDAIVKRSRISCLRTRSVTTRYGNPDRQGSSAPRLITLADAMPVLAGCGGSRFQTGERKPGGWDQPPGRAALQVSTEWTEVLGSERLAGTLLDRLTHSRPHPGEERWQLTPQAASQTQLAGLGSPLTTMPAGSLSGLRHRAHTGRVVNSVPSAPSHAE
jgi:hypothetical protein